MAFALYMCFIASLCALLVNAEPTWPEYLEKRKIRNKTMLLSFSFWRKVWLLSGSFQKEISGVSWSSSKLQHSPPALAPAPLSCPSQADAARAPLGAPWAGLVTFSKWCDSAVAFLWIRTHFLHINTVLCVGFEMEAEVSSGFCCLSKILSLPHMNVK